MTTTKKTPWERLPIRKIRKSTQAQIPIFDVMLATKKIRIFRGGFIAFANSKKTAFATPLFFGF